MFQMIIFHHDHTLAWFVLKIHSARVSNLLQHEVRACTMGTLDVVFTQLESR